MKVDRKKFIEAIEYIKLVNSVPFDELDLSEFPENENVTDEQRKEFKFTGLINKDFIEMYLLSGGIVTKTWNQEKKEWEIADD